MTHEESLTDRALALAANAHRGQVDKQGRDYFNHHLIPVAELLRPFGEYAYVAGILHDIIEDTATTLDDLDDEESLPQHPRGARGGLPQRPRQRPRLGPMGA